MAMIAELQEDVFRISESKGWGHDDRTVGDLIVLMHSELSEAIEAWRDRGDMGVAGMQLYVEEGKPEGVVTELADCVIRIMHFCGRFDLDLENAILTKINFNRTRSHHHGGKKI